MDDNKRIDTTPPDGKRGSAATLVAIGIVAVLAVLGYIYLAGGVDAPDPEDVNTTTLEGDATGDPVDVPAAGTEGETGN